MTIRNRRPMQAVRNLSRQTQQVLAVALLLMLGLWLFALKSVQGNRDTEVMEARQSNLSLALAHQQRASSAIRLIDQALLILRDEHSKSGNPIGIDSRLHVLKMDRTHMGIVSLIAADGGVIESTDPTNKGNYSDREYFKYHAQNPQDQLLIGKPLIGRQTGLWRITLTRRINRPDGSFGGVVFTALDPDFFAAHTNDVDLGPHASVALIGLDGITRVRRNNEKVSYGEDVKGSQLFKEIPQSPAGSYVAKAASDGTLRIVSYAVMTDYPLVVIVASSVGDVMQRLAPIEKQYWIACTLLTVLILSLAYVLISRNLQSRQALEKLESSESRQRTIVEILPVPIGLSNRNAEVTYINAAFTRAFGYTREDIPDFDTWWLKALPDPEYRHWALDVWGVGLRQAEQDANTFGPLQLRICCKDGSEKIVMASGTPLSLAVHSEFLAVFYDITKEVGTTKALEGALKDNVSLLNEVHHRVKNNLQVITSLLRLEAGRSNKPEVNSVLQDMQGRILSMSLVHESLYRSGQFAHVNLAGYLAQLMSLSMRTYRSNEGAVQIRTTLSKLDVALDRATPFGLLLNELVSNAMKHAFPNNASGEIHVSLSPSGDVPNGWTLRVSDNGVGLPPDLDARRSQSLGLQLVFDLAGQIGGQATLQNGQSGGTEFVMTFESESHAAMGVDA